MNIKNYENFNLLKECFSSENPLDQFKINLIGSREFLHVKEVIYSLDIPVQCMIDKDKFMTEIQDWIYFGCIAITNNETEQDFYREIRENMEIEFGSYTVLGVIIVIIGTWAACLYLKTDLNLEVLKRCALDAAYTNYYQSIVENNWIKIEDKMRQYLY